ncbi:MAG: AAA family ATPase [Lentisphaeria bacterium]|nr:AAA family ATPase [Lentisphaeria bacterium]
MKDLTSGVSSFEDLIKGNYFYIDKTEYIWNLIQTYKGLYFLSRPRRFGKSLTLSTLKAVFEGKKELFKGLAIYNKPYDWKPYPVIHLSFGDYNIVTNAKDELPNYLMSKIRRIAQEYSIPLPDDTPANCFGCLIDKISEKNQTVILVDEYDKPILDNITSPDVKELLKILKGFYSVLKDRNDKERLLFVTGVSKFCHVSLFSDLNNLTDITMDARYATMLGYTQEEFEANFKDRIKSAEKNQSLSHKDFLAEIKNWYDGFRFHNNSESVYNPVSIAKFFENSGEFRNYWFETGTPKFLMELTKTRNFDFASALNEPVPAIAFSAFEIDDIDPLTLLYQTGYVTIKGTKQVMGETWYRLDFPNREVSGAFNAYLLNSYSGKTQTGAVKFAAEIVTALNNGDLERLHKAMEVFFAGIPYPAHKKKESTFQTIFFALFRLLGEYIEAESCTDNGRIDAVVQTQNAIYLFEFKMDKNPTALAQIKRKEYFKKYLLDKREIYLIGVNFDSRKGNLTGWKTAKVK